MHKQHLPCVAKFYVFTRHIPPAHADASVRELVTQLLREGPDEAVMEPAAGIVAFLRAQLSAGMLCDGVVTLLGPAYEDDCESPYKLATHADKHVVAFAFYKHDPTTKSLRRWMRRLCVSTSKTRLGVKSEKIPPGTSPVEATPPPRAPDDSNVGGGYNWPGGA